MPKKCVICEETAQFCVKDTSDFYCKGCAEENFGDLTLLLAIEDQAKELKKVIDDSLDDTHTTDDRQDE